MKSKIGNILLFVTICYLVPLWGQWEVFLTIPVAFMVLKTITLVTTQPPITIEGANAQADHDRFSTLGIVVVYIGGQIAAMLEWVFFRGGHVVYDVFFWLGLVLAAGGLVFRVWCIKTLGRFFTTEVQVQQGQRIITEGPYKYVRHPSYLGAYLAIVGSTLLVHAYFSAVATAFLLGVAYYYRIVVEETTLVREFGDEYADYQKVSKRFLPFVY